MCSKSQRVGRVHHKPTEAPWQCLVNMLLVWSEQTWYSLLFQAFQHTPVNSSPTACPTVLDSNTITMPRPSKTQHLPPKSIFLTQAEGWQGLPHRIVLQCLLQHRWVELRLLTRMQCIVLQTAISRLSTFLSTEHHYENRSRTLTLLSWVDLTLWWLALKSRILNNDDKCKTVASVDYASTYLTSCISVPSQELWTIVIATGVTAVVWTSYDALQRHII